MLLSEEELHVMKHELRQSIQRHIWSRGWKKADLASASNLYPSDLSNFMNGNGTRTFPIAALDAVTETLGLPKGELYPLYFGECYSKGKLVKHRCEEFLYRSAELGLQDIADKLIAAMLSESKIYLQTVYSVAKRLFDEKKMAEALPLIEILIVNEANRFSERLATCYFYRFFIVRDKGMEEGYHALVQMLEYLAYMPLEIQLEAYLRITTFYFAREDWEFVSQYAKKLEEIAPEGKYYGEALLYQSFALRECGRYEESLKVTERYEKVNEYYSDIAKVNRLFIYIQEGRIEYIDELILRLDAKAGIYRGLSKILEAYVKAGELAKAKQFLVRFEQDVRILERATNPFVTKLLLNFRYIHGIYLFAISHIEKGIDEVLEAVRLADLLGTSERFKDSLNLFWKYHEYASPGQKEYFSKILLRSE